MSEVSEGEIIDIVYPPSIDNIGKAKWRTREGEVIPVSLLKDSHLRNIALFLMDMGYTSCVAAKDMRIIWLRVLSIEWQRRMMMRRAYDGTEQSDRRVQELDRQYSRELQSRRGED